MPRLCIAATVILASLFGNQGMASARARWTVITILSGRYTEMLERFERTGASDDVNVLVLHADGNRLFGYRSLKDADPTHPAGECCATSGPGCCTTEDIDPRALGIQGLSINKNAVWAFLAHALDAYPADHYLLSFRGHWAGTRILPSVGSDGGSGVSIIELADVLRAFAARRDGKHLEVLNIGLCMGANTEWLYPLAPLADYVVAAANWTNSPVSVRWRNFRWARELIKDPTLSSRDLASRMVDIFAEIADGCAGSAVGCSNASSGQPWVASALDMSRYPAFVSAMRDLSCALVANRIDPIVAAARDDAVCYGSSGVRCAGSSGLRDIQDFAQALRAKVTAPDLVAAIDQLGAAHGALVMQSVVEAGQYRGRSYGLGTSFSSSAANPAEVGDFQFDSDWKLVLDSLTNPGAPSTGVLRLSPVPALPVGGHAEVRAMLSARADLPGCPVPAAWAVDGKAVSATIAAGGMLLDLAGSQVGTARITATFAGQSASLALDVGQVSADGGLSVVDARSDGPTPTADAPADAPPRPVPWPRHNRGQAPTVPGGCACLIACPDRGPPRAWGYGVLLVALLTMRGVRRRGGAGLKDN